MEAITKDISSGQVVIPVGPAVDESAAKATRRKLFEAAMRERWDEVLKIYQEHHVARSWSITRHGENTLHVMVMWARKRQNIFDFIKVLKRLPRDEAKTVLALRDDDGTNALHTAAARGINELCRAMAELAPELVAGSRNNKGETPLFCTHVGGSTSTFLDLCDVAKETLATKEAFINACRRKDKTTILHYAIYREHFELAFHIIRKCPEMVNLPDDNRETPLVFLAQKRHLFRGSYSFGLRQHLVYEVLKASKLRVLDRLEPLSVRLQLLKKGGHGAEEEVDSPWRTRYREYMKRDMARLGSIKRVILAFLGIGTNIQKVLEMKQKHVHAKQIMELLIKHATDWEYDPKENEQNPKEGASISENYKSMQNHTQEVKVSPLLVAARVGVKEIVKGILEKFPIASEDVDATGKNVVLVAVENRHPHIYRHLQKKCLPKDFSRVDKDGNSALHLAAGLGKRNQPWIIPGAALQMQWEIKWYEFVETSFKSEYFFSLYNSEKKMPAIIFTEEHRHMVEEGRAWLKDTATSCSIIVALIATVAFASSATVPGGMRGDSGAPVLKQKPGFEILAISSLMALCFSIISLILFISILTSRFNEKAFKTILPLMLIIALTFMLLSISTSLVTFCSGHFFIINDRLKLVAIPIYAITCLSASLFAMANFNLYRDLVKSTIKHVPERSYM